MFNTMEFMIKTMILILAVIVGMGALFCFATSSTDYFIPFMKLSTIIVASNCLGMTVLYKA